MNRENEHISESNPEVSALEASLAELRPRREARFTDEVKSRMREAMATDMPSSNEATAMVKVPLTHYIRIAQFNAAAGGLMAGLLIGLLLGASGVYFLMARSEDVRQPFVATPPGQVQSPYAEFLMENDPLLAPHERALFEKRYRKETSDGRE